MSDLQRRAVEALQAYLRGKAETEAQSKKANLRRDMTEWATHVDFIEGELGVQLVRDHASRTIVADSITFRFKDSVQNMAVETVCSRCSGQRWQHIKYSGGRGYLLKAIGEALLSLGMCESCSDADRSKANAEAEAEAEAEALRRAQQAERMEAQAKADGRRRSRRVSERLLSIIHEIATQAAEDVIEARS